MNLELKVERFASEDVIATSSVSHSDKLAHIYRGTDSVEVYQYCETDQIFHYWTYELNADNSQDGMTAGNWYYLEDLSSDDPLPCTDDSHYLEKRAGVATPASECSNVH